MIAIIDYGVGNLASIRNMLSRCGVNSVCTSSMEEILSAEKIILPGVGAFDYAMERIEQMGLRTVIHTASTKGIRILGICLGAQLLMESSEEGKHKGLSLIKGVCKKFDANALSPLRVPHMGWEDVAFTDVNHPLANFTEGNPRFYFTHSYYIECENHSNRLATCHYGHTFTCAVVNKNVMGVQFHPEKSHVYGLKLLTNFASM